MNNFSCIIIGNTGVTISCAELLLQKKCNILAIISNDIKVKKWAAENFIKCSNSIEDIVWDIEFDYLFSIANPIIIPRWLIEKPNKLAINYHDSLLPKYAGTNATSWAILNGELYHGISWHIIDTKVDAGDILQQPVVKIGDTETTFSLNLKCFEVALESFSKLLESLHSQTLEKRAQELSERTFYYKYKKPANGGIVNWFRDSKEIDRLCRALNFGNNSNNFCTAKILINSKLYIITSHKLKEHSNKIKSNPGKVISVLDKSFEVLAEGGSIVIDGLMDPFTPSKVIGQILEECNLKEGDQLLSLSEKELSEYQSNLEAIAKKHNVLVGELDIFNNLQLKYKTKNEISRSQSKGFSISAKDQEKIIQWNLTDSSDFEEITIHKLFEDMVDEVPESIAVSYEDNYITYKELNARANGLANYLLSLENNSDTQKTIGILMNRSIEMVISIIASLKAGMAYIPVDTNYPYERTKHMLQDANVKFVITTTEFNNLVSAYTTPIFIDRINIINQNKNLGLYNIKNLIYILYTSGSTGLPKGADLIHLGVSNLLTWYKKEFKINYNDKILIFTAFGFDLTQKNILGGLISGATVNLFSQKMFDAREIANHIKLHKITFINCPPSAFYSITDESSREDIKSLRIILLGGENIKLEQIRRFREKNDSCTLVNTYGPTECSDLALTHILTDSEINCNITVPLGRNVRNVSVFILDSNLNMLPVGEIGEIYIGGISLGMGYRNRPDNTSRIFIANPFTNNNEFPNALGAGSRIYKTGDLGKYLEDGKIEFLGRIDHQVKIRGFRIELNEIESVIASVNGIKQNVVIVFEEEGIDRKKIVVYVVSDSYKTNIVELIREACVKNLPDYMQPNQIILLDKIPLTPNGKIDRAVLPKPTGREGMGEYKKPKSGTEETLSKILSNLLHISDISSTDNFFRLGGDSIIAIKVVALMKKEGYEIKISDLYNFKTIEDLSKNISIGKGLEHESYNSFSLIKKENLSNVLNNNIDDIYPVSFLQKGMLIESLKDIKTYHDVFSYNINQEFDFDKFFKIWNFLVRKHPILRTSFIEHQDYTYLALEYKDILLNNKIILKNDDNNISKLVHDEASVSFKFDDPGLFRLIIVNKNKNSFDMIISFHHALADGWSLASLINEFVDSYICGKQEISTSPIPSYAEFVREEINHSKIESYLDSWKSILNNFENESYINKFVDDKILGDSYSASFYLKDSDSLKIIKYSEKQGIPVDTVFLSAFVYALSRVGNSNDIVLGLIVNNRPERINSEKQLGLYLNTIPFRYILNRKTNLIDINYLINDINLRKAKFLEIKRYPYLKLKQDLHLPNNFYEFCFNYVHFHILSKQIQDGMVDTGPFHEKTDLPCTLDVWRKLNNFTISLNINNTSFSKGEIESILSHLRYFLDMVIEEKDYISKTTPENITNIIKWNETQKEYPSDKMVNELFEEQVEKSSDSVAIIYEDKQLTYRELNERVNQLAHYLKENYETKPDELVALCLDRSENMLIAILAVLKAGGAYVPMDPEYPDERIEYILKDTNARVVIVNEIYEERLKRIARGLSKESKKTNNKKEMEAGSQDQGSQAQGHIEILSIDSKGLSVKLKNQAKTNLDQRTNSNNLAYVIYTSGTTGNPKGVMIGHKGVVNRIKWMNDTYTIYINDKIIQKTPYTFDVSVWELLWGICYGASIIFIKADKHKDPEYLINFISKQSISVVHFVPSMLNVFFDILDKEREKNSAKFLTIKYLFCSGEALGLDLVKKSQNLLNDVKIHNLYGPTEASIDVLSYDCNDRGLKKVFIGRPIDNTGAYILDRGLSVLPIGAVGELYVGGVGLARGYLNRADLTAERFIANPFRSEEEIREGKNGRLYKTGDLVRWMDDGNLEYIGRNDFQVKIRGYRIELGEIENQLIGYERVEQAVVIAKESKKGLDGGRAEVGSKYLVGYYVSEVRLDEEEILKYLGSKLPDYMVPSVLVYMNKLPLTVNGKLDRKALPDPEFVNEDNYVVPRNDIEKKLCSIWSELLEIEESKLGIRDSFFGLGGDSIVSIQLVSRIRQRLNLNVSIKDIFQYKTIESIYDNVISKQDKTDQIVIRSEQGRLIGEVSLLPIQGWFLNDSGYRDKNYYNQSFMIKVSDLDIDRLRSAIKKLVGHHDSFRMRYKRGEKGYVQYYDVDVNIDPNGGLEELKYLDISRDLNNKEGEEGFEAELGEILTSWQSGFDIERGPVYSFGYITGYKDGSSRIYAALHHLIVDGVSWRILCEDIKSLYEGKELGNKGSSYRQFVDSLSDYKGLGGEKEYWDNIKSEYQAQIKEGVIEEIVDEEVSEENFSQIRLSEEETRSLLKEVNEVYNTEINDILLSSLGMALRSVSGSKENYITLEGHGREAIDESIDITRTLGWFTTMYPVKIRVEEETSDTIKSVKEGLRLIPNKGIGYGVLYGYEDMPKIVFNYLGQFEGESKAVWNIVNEDSGRQISKLNKDRNIISINGLISGRRLEFYIGAKLRKEVVSEFVENFGESLRNVIEHCKLQDRRYLTVSDVDRIVSKEYLDRIQGEREVEAIYLANSLQQGFIYHALNQGEVDDAYRVQSVWDYKTKIDKDKLRKAWGYAQKKYSSLRLRFGWEEELVQIIDKEVELDFRYIDLSLAEESLNGEKIDKEVRIKEIQEEDRKEIYRLDEGKLLRLYLIKREEELYSFIFSSHHAILDGWSNQILLDYVHKKYIRLLDNKEGGDKGIDERKEDDREEETYKLAQKYLQEKEGENEEYWKEYVGKIEDKADLSGLLKNKEIRLSEYRHIKEVRSNYIDIKGDLYKRLKKLSKEEGATLNAILQYVWHKVIGIYGNVDQTVVGTTLSGRNIKIDNIEESVGLYINTLPLIVDHRKENATTIIEGIKEIQDNINEINERSNISLGKLQKEGKRLFDSLYF